MVPKNTFEIHQSGPRSFQVLCHTTDGRVVEVGSSYRKCDAAKTMKHHQKLEDTRVAEIEAMLKRMGGE